MSDSVADAVLAVAVAAVPGRQVSDALVLTTPDPTGHAVVYCTEGQLSRNSVAATADSKRVWFQVSSFGPTRQAAGWFSRKFVAYFFANGVDVPGWGHGVVDEHYARIPAADEDVKEFPVVQYVDQFWCTLSKDS